MATAHPHHPFSTTVRIRLEVAGMSLNVAQVGGQSLILRDKVDLPPTDDAHLVISVDGDEQSYPIVLHEGIDSKKKTVWFQQPATGP